MTDLTVNEGRGRAGASWTGYTLVNREARIRLGIRPVPALKGGERSRGAAELLLPGNARGGTYRLIACADVRGDVREHGERNNCRSASRRLVVDNVAPVAPTVGERPDAATNSASMRIAFSHPEPDVTFACRLDGEAERACTSPFESAGLAEAPHRFEVRAIDAAGNRGPVAVVEWTVDLTPPPAPTIDERPASVSAADSARFAFHDAEPGVQSFRCALDDAEPSDCQSPIEYSALADDEHTFTVLALDAAGNASDAAQVSWTIIPVQATLGDGAWSLVRRSARGAFQRRSPAHVRRLDRAQRRHRESRPTTTTPWCARPLVSGTRAEGRPQQPRDPDPAGPAGPRLLVPPRRHGAVVSDVAGAPRTSRRGGRSSDRDDHRRRARLLVSEPGPPQRRGRDVSLLARGQLESDVLHAG